MLWKLQTRPQHGIMRPFQLCRPEVWTRCSGMPWLPNEASPISLPPFCPSQDMKDPLGRYVATPGGGSYGHREGSTWGQRGQ